MVQPSGTEHEKDAGSIITSAPRRIRKDSPAAPARQPAEELQKPSTPAAKRARHPSGLDRGPSQQESGSSPAEAAVPGSALADAEDAENLQPETSQQGVAERDLVLEQGADGVPGKAGAPGSADPATCCREASGVSTDTTMDDRVLCPLPAKGDADSNEADLAVVAFEEEDLDGEEANFDPYAFIKALPPLATCAAPWRHTLLPRQTRTCKRKTLVLDLDETLVHSSLEDVGPPPDFSFTVTFNQRDHNVQVRRRPHLQQFLERCAALFEVVVFTASQKVYAEQLLNVLDPSRRLIRHRIFRDSCVFVDGNYLKDLSVLGRDLAHTLIIDNSPQAFGFQLCNGIPIESWYDDDKDEELLGLLPFLERCAKAEDVRPLIQAQFKLEQMVANAHGPLYNSYD